MNQGTANGMGGWRKSRRCETAACVEMDVRGSVVLMRDSKDPDGTVLEFTLEEWDTFCADVRGAWDVKSVVDVLHFGDGSVRVARTDALARSLTFSHEEWDVFMTGMVDGEFDAPQPVSGEPRAVLLVGVESGLTDEAMDLLTTALEKVYVGKHGPNVYVLRGVTAFAALSPDSACR